MQWLQRSYVARRTLDRTIKEDAEKRIKRSGVSIEGRNPPTPKSNKSTVTIQFPRASWWRPEMDAPRSNISSSLVLARAVDASRACRSRRYSLSLFQLQTTLSAPGTSAQHSTAHRVVTLTRQMTKILFRSWRWLHRAATYLRV